jgi:hypothetical protein
MVSGRRSASVEGAAGATGAGPRCNRPAETTPLADGQAEFLEVRLCQIDQLFMFDPLGAEAVNMAL